MGNKTLRKIWHSLIVVSLIATVYSYANVNSYTPDLKVKAPKPLTAADVCVSSYDSFIEGDWKRKSCTGAAFVVVKDGKVALVKTVGLKDAITREPVTESSVFRVGSLSKGFAGVLAGMLVDEGVITWDDHVKEWMPEFCLQTAEATQSMEVENILSHSTGLIRHAYTNLIEDGKSIDQIAAEFQHVDIVGQIGKSYAYQNAAYSLIEKVVESATGDTYEDLLEDRIFGPLKMPSASCSFDEINAQSDIARPHSYHGKRIRISKKYYNSISSGGVNASITDMAEWLKLLTGHYPYLLDEEALDEIFTPRVNTRRDRRYYNRWPGFKDSHYAIGWRVLDLGDRELVHHGGYVNGYRSEIAIDRENDIAICALFNSPCRYAEWVVPNFFEYIDECQSSAVESTGTNP